jgi:hypothetical protein
MSHLFSEKTLPARTGACLEPVTTEPNPSSKGRPQRQPHQCWPLTLATGLVTTALYAAGPLVEIEEAVYDFEPARNGAGPMWCSGSTCLVRVGDRLFASGLETLPQYPPLNNCRWLLFTRTTSGWKQVQADPSGRTREPCPLAVLSDGTVLLSANPTLATNPAATAGPARPEILAFRADAPEAPPRRIEPRWEGRPVFTEHSYRSLAADGPANAFVLFQNAGYNIGYTHAEWVYYSPADGWKAGRLPWPEGHDYPTPQPVRICYPNVLLRNHAVFFCGVSDIVEPYPEWRQFKKELTGQDWDYDFRRLFFTWSPDLTREPFRPWVEISSRDRTAGRIQPGDLWVAADGTVHVVWYERALDERLRPKFFPEARQSHGIYHASLRDGRLLHRCTLHLAEEGGSREIPSLPRFHVTPDQRLWVVYYVHGTDTTGRPVSENRLVELRPAHESLTPVRIPLRRPFVNYFTATVRAGSPPSDVLDLLGIQEGRPQTVAHARIRLPPNLP